MGHFERLDVTFDLLSGHEFRDKASVAKALIRTINANPNLTYLRVTSDCWDVTWGEYLPQIFNAIEEHKELRTFALWEYPSDEDPTYSWLERLLSRNRNITILEHYGKRWIQYR